MNGSLISDFSVRLVLKVDSKIRIDDWVSLHLTVFAVLIGLFASLSLMCGNLVVTDIY